MSSRVVSLSEELDQPQNCRGCGPTVPPANDGRGNCTFTCDSSGLQVTRGSRTRSKGNWNCFACGTRGSLAVAVVLAREGSSRSPRRCAHVTLGTSIHSNSAFFGRYGCENEFSTLGWKSHSDRSNIGCKCARYRCLGFPQLARGLSKQKLSIPHSTVACSLVGTCSHGQGFKRPGVCDIQFGRICLGPYPLCFHAGNRPVVWLPLSASSSPTALSVSTFGDASAGSLLVRASRHRLFPVLPCALGNTLRARSLVFSLFPDSNRRAIGVGHTFHVDDGLALLRRRHCRYSFGSPVDCDSEGESRLARVCEAEVSGKGSSDRSIWNQLTLRSSRNRRYWSKSIRWFFRSIGLLKCLMKQWSC